MEEIIPFVSDELRRMAARKPGSERASHILSATALVHQAWLELQTLDRIRSDIWSLGIVIHEMLSGARPFNGDDGPAVLEAILNQEPRLTARSHPDVPPGTDGVLYRTLAKTPEQRYGSMFLLAADLSVLGAACNVAA
jgi:serine/threonine protein kinase